MAPPRPLQHAPHTVRSPTRNSTESGTHNAVVAAAYGWVIHQANDFCGPGIVLEIELHYEPLLLPLLTYILLRDWMTLKSNGDSQRNSSRRHRRRSSR
eukprot:4038240-Pyramimonas_sp.AAC.1